MTARIPLSLASTLSQTSQFTAKLWKISRDDTTVLYFTDHSSPIEFEGNSYAPAGGASASAFQDRSGLREGNKSITGIVLDNDSIKADDLRAGRYDGAQIDEYMVDWRIPYVGAYLFRRYWIVEVSWDGQQYSAEVSGLTTFLRQEKGDVYSRDCIWHLGQNCDNSEPGCKFNSSTMWISGEVTSVNNQRIDFNTDISTVLNSAGGTRPNEDDWFQFGWVIFENGDNRLLPPMEVARSYATNGQLVLSYRLPFDIQVGDRFVVEPGCDKQRTTCINKFNNIDNHRGHDFIPGTDAMLETPNAK